LSLLFRARAQRKRLRHLSQGKTYGRLAAQRKRSVPDDVSGTPIPQTHDRKSTIPPDVTATQRKKLTLKHDPEKCVAVFPRDKRQRRLRGDHAQSKS
jgi:hypothetical protein